jgi:hypothetical protein
MVLVHLRRHTRFIEYGMKRVVSLSRKEPDLLQERVVGKFEHRLSVAVVETPKERILAIIRTREYSLK